VLGVIRLYNSDESHTPIASPGVLHQRIVCSTTAPAKIIEVFERLIYFTWNSGQCPGRNYEFFSSPRRPDRLWGPPILLSSGLQGLFLRGANGRGVKLTTHLHLVPRLRMRGAWLGTGQLCLYLYFFTVDLSEDEDLQDHVSTRWINRQAEIGHLLT